MVPLAKVALFGIHCALRFFAAKREGLVTRVIFGEKWSVFEEDAHDAIERCPELRGDRDLNRSDEGITIALLV